ncbi:MAG: uroporphyrinogen-III C-methyltransferase [Gammaproteobacteria bacterium]|nr:uroporphyrinogen-III C-methyltransferase [Gammaproteobacteria bacterium]
MVERSTTEQEAQQISPKSTKVRSFFSVLAFLVILLVLAAGMGLLWKKEQAIINATLGQVDALKENVQSLNQEVADEHTLLEKQQMAMNNFLNNQSTDNMHWQLEEARYLIRLANLSVSFEHNVPVAIDLLETADSRITSLNDMSLLPLRQLLANDISALKGVAQLDIPAVLLQLNALADQVGKLPVISTPNAVPAETTPKHHHHQPGWKRGLAQSWQELKQIIVVQYHDQPVGHLITPQNRQYLDLHLQMLLSQAEWGCLHQQGVLYANSIQQAIDWVKNYYVESAPQTQAMLAGLTALQQQVISPPMPDISDSLQLINVKITDLSTPNGAAVL